MATFLDPATRERTLLEELERGNGVVSGEFWHSLARVIITDDKALQQLEDVGRSWRRERGMSDEDFVLGVGE